MTAKDTQLPPNDLKAAQLEAIHDEKMLEETGRVVHGGDYSGAAKKTDPAEIALVRKLDRMIMVRLLAFKLRAELTNPAHPLGHVLPQLPRPKCSPSSTTEHSRGGSEP